MKSHSVKYAIVAVLLLTFIVASLLTRQPADSIVVDIPAAESASAQPQATGTSSYVPRSQPYSVEQPSQPVPQQVVIQFAPNTTQEERAAYVESVGGVVVESIESLNTVVVALPEETAQEPLPQSAFVAQSEPDYYVYALGDIAPINDPRYIEQWALPAIGAPSAWAELPADAPKVTVAVIDSGICASHPDLAGRIIEGWDFLESDATPQDDFGHGCSVAGVIAANMNDGIGIAGVAPNAQIMPLRVLNASGVGSYSDVAAAIVYAADHGAQVINLSLGGASPSATLENAVNYAISKGVIIVAAAGNSGTEGALYPAAYPDVIAVGSVDPNLQHSSFSNYGSQIDIWAPGRDILTTKRDGSYGLVSGTSFAAPYVTGAEVLINILNRQLMFDGKLLLLSTSTITPTITPLTPTSTPVDITSLPTPEEHEILTPPADIVIVDNQSIDLPNFQLPYDKNLRVAWTGGPHAYRLGGQFKVKYPTGEGTGLDFSNGGNFKVLAMATGEVVEADCLNNGSFGCQVAIQHFTGGTVMIYAHLQTSSIEVKVGDRVVAGTPLGKAGNTGGQDNTHLHIEFRNGQKDADGNWVCWRQCLPNNLGGNPFGWDDGIPFVDEYNIFSYIADGEGLESYNYDGSAVNGNVNVLDNFHYSDSGDTRTPFAVRVGINFSCLYPNNTNIQFSCELPQNHNNPGGSTKFASTDTAYSFLLNPLGTTSEINALSINDVNYLVSTNTEIVSTADNVLPTGSWSNPSNNSTISSSNVTLTVNASDNSGGSGVKEVRWSAKWGGNWYYLGADTSSPYSMSWNMCNSGVPNGDVELGLEVWDNANNKWVYSEHYTNYHITKNYSCTTSSNDTTPPTVSWTSPSGGSTINSKTVTLSANANDNAGGSGVREVRWSALFNGQWSGIGNDSTYPYSMDWDMCNAGVPKGDVELGMEVWDNANNVWIYSQHYTNIHINMNFDCGGNTGTGDPLAGSPWNTQAWQNKYMAGYTNWEGTFSWGTYPYIYNDWGSGAPFGWGGNEFSMRLWRNVYFPGGYYSFMTQHDDGIKVYLDGNLIIDAWWDGSGGHDAGRNVSAGYHEVKVEYYENQGDAKLQLVWYGPGYPAPDNNPPDGKITFPTNLSASNASTVNISADAWDDASGVDRVDFYAYYCQSTCSTYFLGSDNTSPYTYSWNWSGLPDTRVWLRIDVSDKTGKWHTVAGDYVIIDRDRVNPTTSITSPAANSYLSTNQITINASANDDRSGVQKVQFFAGYNETAGAGALGEIAPPLPEDAQAESSDVTAQDYWHEIGWDENGSDGWSFTWASTSVPDQGGASFFIYAYDKAGNYQGAQVWPVMLDRAAPTSAINALATYTGTTSFTVSWTSSDTTSGIANYDIQYKDNGGAWTTWLSATSSTSATFAGTVGHIYAFQSRARDRAGNLESWPASADAQTTLVAVPSNNSFGSVIAIGTIPYTHTIDTRGATTAADDPTPTCGYGKNSNSVWYKYVAPANGLLEIDTWGSDYDTVLAVWTGTSSSLTQIQCNDDLYEYTEAWLENVPVTAGVTYYIEAMDYGNPSGGNLKLYVNFASTPSNDDFNTPTTISSMPYSNTQDVRGATKASDDPSLTTCNRLPGTNSVWYKYTTTAAGLLNLDTMGSSYDTMLAVWSGMRGNLILIRCNDDIGNGDADSALAAQLQSGTTYYIEASRYNGEIDINGASATGIQDKPEKMASLGDVSNLQNKKAAIEKGDVSLVASQGDRGGDVSAQLWGGQLQLHANFRPTPTNSILYMTENEGTLRRVNQATGATTIVGNLGTNSIHGLSNRPGDTTYIYGVEPSRLVKINTITGASTPLPAFDQSILGVTDLTAYAVAISPAMPNIAVITGISINNGVNYYLWKVNVDTGIVMGPAISTTAWLKQLTYNLDGSLIYGVNNDGQLVTVNSDTGAVTLIGDPGLSSFIEGLAFRPSDGALFAIDGYDQDRLVKLDATNGNLLEIIGGLGVGGPNGLAFIPGYQMSVNKSGNGSGTVTSNPTGISCSSTCSYYFNYDVSVTLTATPSAGSTFTGWSGGGCSGTGACTVTMSSAQSVTAIFTLNTYSLSISKSGTGSGTITSNPTGVNCGSICSYSYNYNTSVTLTAVSSAGSTFTGWSGGECSGTGTCTVIIDSAHSVVASFYLLPTTPTLVAPLEGTTLPRTSNTLLDWNTTGTTCTVHVWGGSIDIFPSGSCADLTLGEQRGGAYSWQVTATNAIGSTTGPVWHFNVRPYAPTVLLASIASSTQVNLAWTLSSDETADVDSYDIYRNGTLLTNVSKGTTSYSATGLTCNTGYSFYLRARRQDVQSDNSNTVNITPPCPPSAFNKSSPANLATGQPINLTLSWASSTNAVKYEYCIDIETVNNGTCDTSWVTGTATSATLSNLDFATTYYWQVRAVNSINVETYANTNTWHSFTTGTLPVAFTKASPSDTATFQPVNPTLSWAASAGATSYKYCYNTSPTCTAWSSAITGASATISGLSLDTTYYWHVQAINIVGHTYSDSDTWHSFTTNAYVISGNTEVGVAAITYTGGSTATDGSGNYSFRIPNGWSGTVTPSMTGYAFQPANKSYTNVTEYQTQDYKATPTYTLTYIAGAGGTIVGTTPQTVAHGSDGTLVTATPAAGYHFLSWSDGALAAARTDLNVTANKSVTAIFAINTYTLTYTAGAGGSIVGDSSQTVNHGANGTLVTATSAAGYHFVSWSDGYPTAARTDLNVTANISVTANFTVYNTATFNPSWYGSVSITSDKNVVAVGRPHIGSEVASYDGFASGSLTAYVPMLFKTAWGSYDSALYIQDVSTNPANVTIKFYDSAGVLTCTKTDTISALSSKGYWLPSEPESCLPTGWVGGAVVTSTKPIVAVGRPHVGGQVMTYNGFTAGSKSMYLPMLFKNAYGSYNSAFYIQNVNTTNTANITIKYYDSAGSLLCTKSDIVAPLASKGYWAPSETCIPDGWVGGVVVTSDQDIVAIGRPHIGSQVTTYNGFAGGGSNMYVPMLFKNAYGGSYDSALYIQNVHASNPAAITIKYYDSDGALSCTKTDTIEPLASKGYWLPSELETCLPIGWVGGAIITSTQPIATIGRPHLGAEVTTYNGFSGGSLNSFVPMLFKNMWGTYNSAFYVQNTDAANPASVTVKFYDADGNLSCVRSDSIPALSTLGYWAPTVTCEP